MATAGAQPTPQPAPAEPPADSSALSWEGDRMFNVYIYDYCNKRGFLKTAKELCAEATLDPESRPPIDAKQGLLYEWWSVFWVLFTAKNGNGNGHEDAQIYVEHQRSRARIATGQPQPPAARYINGGMPPRQPGALPPNMPMPNGVGTPAPPGGQPSMPNGVTGPAPFHMHPQPNGAPAPPGGPSPQQQPGQQFPPHMLAMGQRPGPPQQQQPGQQQPGQQQPGQPGQQRGMPNYQSPTMAPSPQGTHPGQPGQGPSPQMQHMVRGGMPPPQGMQGGGPGGPMQQPPTPSFQPMGARPPSRPVTPAKPMMLPSPSMQNRLIGQPADMRQMHAGATVEAEYSRLQPAHVQQLKQELGIDRDMPSLTFDDKNKIVMLSRQRLIRAPMKPGMPLPPNAVAGPSGMQPGAMQPPNQRSQPLQQQTAQRIKRNSTSPGDEDSSVKIESSPPDRKRMRTSPNNAEQGGPQPPFPPQQMGAPGAQGGGPQNGPQPMHNGMMTRPGGGPMIGPPGMSPFPGGGPMPPNMSGNPGMQMGPQGMGPMPPHMMNMMQGIGAPGGPMSAQQISAAMAQAGAMNRGPMGPQNPQVMEYRKHVQDWHSKNHPAGTNTGSPATPGDGPGANNAFGLEGGLRPPGQFTPVMPSRMVGQPGGKPLGMMPPPQSPGQKPPGAKDGPPDGRPAPSPQLASAGPGGPQGMPGSQAGTNPPTPVPGQQGGMGMKAPSPSQILGTGGGGGGGGNGGGQQSSGGLGADFTPNIFPPDFMSSVVNSLDDSTDVDGFGLFSNNRPDNDLNFERDFAEWFTPNPVEDALIR